MIPKELKNTHKILKELNDIEEQEELNILKIENPELANQIEASKHAKEIFLSEPDEQLKRQINESFKDEYRALNKTKTYFLGCSKNNYIANYDNRLKAFKSNYTDAEEHNFIHEELKAIIFFKLPIYINDKLIKSINYSLERTKELLITKLEVLGFNISFSINDNGIETLSIKNMQKDLSINKLDNSKLVWEGTETDLIELGKAIYEAKYINHNIKQKDFFNLLMAFFNKNVPNPTKALQNIRNRKIDETKLIHRLEQKLKDWQSNYG